MKSTACIRTAVAGLTALLALTGLVSSANGQTTLADAPIFAGAGVPGNLALVLSVEYPTAISVSNITDYADGSTFLGYFDPVKCYNYNYNSGTPNQSYFQPAAFGTGTYSHQCSGKWSGNFMNWAAMQTIDPFRWALTGGYRSYESATQTILEKAWGSAQGSTANFPVRGSGISTPNNLPTALISKVTPLSYWPQLNTSVWSNGNMMVLSEGTSNVLASNILVADLPSDVNAPDLAIALLIPNNPLNLLSFRLYVRVSVCDTSILGVAGLESNCVKYGSNYKPEGLLQQYSNQIRYADLSYLNGNGASQQGGVLREPMGFIGPTYPQPLSSTVITNSRAEWSASTGQQFYNPDPTTASASNVPQSGVINYLNSFGEYAASVGNYSSTYMLDDNVSELYYAAVRYYENLGNVPQWSTAQTTNTTTELDGFPAVQTWIDPIAYSCQQNFILGIGDDHTHDDYNTAGNGGATNPGLTRPDPAAVSSDNFNQAQTWLYELETLEGMSQSPWWQYYGGGGSYSTYLIAGLAYGTHVLDIRPDLTGTQTISTYFMDVEEYGAPEYQNQYYLATKYGGFTVPSNYDITTTTPLTQSSWTGGTTMSVHTTAGSYQTPSAYTTALQPNNYFLAGGAASMVSSLKSAFSNIAIAIQAYANSYSFSGSSVSSTGTESFASQYNSNGWTGVITASTLSFNSSGVAVSSTLWSTNTTLQTQLGGTGWQSARNVATWNGTTGVPFETSSLSSTQLSALVPSSYSSATTSTQYLNYLRGDQSNEQNSTTTGSTRSLRTRTLLLGDIVDANLAPVTTPIQVYSDANNPGYAAFKSTWASRPTMVYAGANDGMVHAFLGSSGTEQFAYVPSALFQGPTGTPQTNGLAELGNPTYVHHAYVDATPAAFDIDLGHTGGTTSTPNWRTLLIGGLGKGGKSFYAIDITNPAGMSTEATVASSVKWEFTEPTMGFSYGTPIVIKTAQWGWVVAFTSGYDNSDGYGHLYLVNPSTGALIQDIATPSASIGLTQASAYVLDYSDNTADSIYVGDLNGQLWRFPLTAATGNYPAPTLLATLTDSSGNQQPITTAPLIEIAPTTRYRYVMVGTGQLLSTSDVINGSMQTFYAIIDGTAGGFNTVSTPITRSNLTQLTNVLQGVTLATGSKGWYFDLGISGSITWRVVTNPVAFDGIVAFSALLTSGNACNPSGQSEVYALNYATATSVIQSSLGSSTIVADLPIPSNVTTLRFFTNATTAGTNGNGSAGGPELIGGCSNGCITPVPLNYGSGSATRLLNWREIPTAE